MYMINCHNAHVQNVIASHESNGLDIIIALLLSEINPLRKQRIDLVLQLKVSFICEFEVCRISEALTGIYVVTYNIRCVSGGGLAQLIATLVRSTKLFYAGPG